MKKMRKKRILKSAIVMAMIAANVALLPFVNVISLFFFARNDMSQQVHAGDAEMSKAVVGDAASYFVSNANQDQTLASCKRAAQTCNPISNRLIYFTQYRWLSESQSYSKTNDLPYNLPRIIYLLSSSEHATEG